MSVVSKGVKKTYISFISHFIKTNLYSVLLKCTFRKYASLYNEHVKKKSAIKILFFKCFAHTDVGHSTTLVTLLLRMQFSIIMNNKNYQLHQGKSSIRTRQATNKIRTFKVLFFPLKIKGFLFSTKIDNETSTFRGFWIN